jgi:hypothetical protein
MMPALQIRMSSFGMRVRICFAEVWMEGREARSSGMKVKVVVGNWEFRVVRRDSARLAERPVKRMWAGEWAARVRIVFSPTPAVPVGWLA